MEQSPRSGVAAGITPKNAPISTGKLPSVFLCKVPIHTCQKVGVLQGANGCSQADLLTSNLLCRLRHDEQPGLDLRLAAQQKTKFSHPIVDDCSSIFYTRKGESLFVWINQVDRLPLKHKADPTA